MSNIKIMIIAHLITETNRSCLCIYVRIYAYVYVYTYVCRYVRMYIHVCFHLGISFQSHMVETKVRNNSAIYACP